LNIQDLDKYKIRFGKFKGKELQKISLKDLDSYLGWLEVNFNTGKGKCLIEKLKVYLKHYEKELEKLRY